MRGKARKLRVAAAALICAATLVPATPASAGGKQCRSESLDVRLGGKVHTQAATLCWRGSLHGKKVQALVSGFTYDSSYFDFPGFSGRHSYVDAAVRAGHATYNVDRLGTGRSDRLPAAELTGASEAEALRQTVAALNRRFGTVIGVGHSLGAALWLLAGADVDALILADFLHAGSAAFRAELASMRVSVGDGFLTTSEVGNARGRSFYNLRAASQKVVDQDDRLKAWGTPGELAALGAASSASSSVPTLLVVGQRDAIFCDVPAGLLCGRRDILAREDPFYGRLDVFVVPFAGHSSNLHLTGPLLFAAANRWARSI